MRQTLSIAVMNRLALTWPKRGTHRQLRGVRPANSTLPCSRQIQFLSRTYESWLKQPTKTGEICHFLQDWPFLSDCCGDGMSSPVARCLRSWLSWHFCVLPHAVMHLFPFICPHTTFPCPHNHSIMISPSVFIIPVWCTWLHLLACELITTQVMIMWP